MGHDPSHCSNPSGQSQSGAKARGAGCACESTARGRRVASLQAGVWSKNRVSEPRGCGVASALLCHSSVALLLFYFHSWMHSLKELTAQHRRPGTQSAFSLSRAHTHTVTGWHHRGSSEGRRTHTTRMTQCETPALALKRTAFLLPCDPPLSPPSSAVKAKLLVNQKTAPGESTSDVESCKQTF